MSSHKLLILQGYSAGIVVALATAGGNPWDI